MATSALLGMVDPKQLSNDLKLERKRPLDLRLRERPPVHERIKVRPGLVRVEPTRPKLVERPKFTIKPGSPKPAAPKADTFRIQFAGIYCLRESFTDGGSDSDEPYVLFTVFTKGQAGDPAKVLVTRSAVYENVHDGIDSGDDWGPLPPLMYVFGADEPQPAQDIGILATVMEHDHGDPNKYRDVIKAGVGAVAAGVTAWTGVVVPEEVQGLVTSGVNAVVDSGDDVIATAATEFSAASFAGMAGLPLTHFKQQLHYHFFIECAGGDAHYFVFFRVVQDPPPNHSAWQWSRVGGEIKDSPAIAARTNTRRDVFVRGQDDRLWQNEWTETAGWGTWRSDDPAGGLASGVTAISAGPDVLEAYVRGTEGNAWCRAWHADGGWQPWLNHGGQIQGPPSACARTFSTRDVVVWGTDNHLWLKQFDGGAWSDWQFVDVVMTSPPSICAVDATTFDVYFRGTNDALFQIFATVNGWGPVIAHDGKLASPPIAVCPDPTRREILARGADGALWHKRWFQSAGWQAWERVGGEISAAPGAVSAGGLLDVVVRDSDGALSNAWRA